MLKYIQQLKIMMGKISILLGIQKVKSHSICFFHGVDWTGVWFGAMVIVQK